MSEIDELPSWAGRVLDEDEAAPAETVAASGGQEQPNRRRGLLYTVLGLALIAAVAIVALFLTHDDSGISADGADRGDSAEVGAAADGADSGTDTDTDTGATDPPAAESTTSTTAAAAPPASSEDAEEGAGDDPATEDADPEADTGEGATDPSNADGSVRYAVFKGGQVYLRGRVPDEEVGQTIEARAGAVVGPENVHNEYEIDPDAPASASAPLYVEDVILFGFNSVHVDPAFLPLLDLGTLLLVQNPTVEITVVTRTDAVGSEASNLEVSRLRAQAVINYWLGKGIDRERLHADPRGEEGASEDDDAETAALSRRAEFIITGLLE